MSVVLERLRKNNEYPIVFIGSGMSKRYLNGFPSWVELLQKFWGQLETKQDFYAYLNSLRTELRKNKPGITDEELTHLTNISAGTYIESAFNDKFYKQGIEIENFSQKDAYRSNISPFKKAVSNVFKHYTLRDGIIEEYKAFKKFLNKTQIILTTNYDTLIEDSIKLINENGIRRYIGQRGFFQQTYGWSELYKIHGSIECPESIVISKEDYEEFDKNSILISAKIISLLINSPIIFLGYSLTDMNVRKIIRDFSSSLSKDDIKNMGSRIIVVEREEGNQNIEEQIFYDKDLGCEYVVLKTDNFLELYNNIIQINQGVSPSEVRRYQHVIKRLIVDSGKKGSLNTLLLAPEQLEEIEKRIGEGNLVVAIGDNTYIFNMPDLMSYICDYIYEKNEIHTDIALRFVASQGKKSRIPFLRHVLNTDIDSTNLNPIEKEKIRQRIQLHSEIRGACINSINSSNRIRKGTVEEIISENFNLNKEMDVVTYNIEQLVFNDVERYVKEKIEEFIQDGAVFLSTSMRRLLLAYDFLKYKKGDSA